MLRGNRNVSIAETIHSYIKGGEKVLIAIDAPLGWPQNLGIFLQGHKAGGNLNIDAHNLFRRETDKFVKRKIGKQSLDVGADRIARTAYAALAIINDLRYMTNSEISLAWDKNFNEKVSVIEVYPAATLISYGIPSSGYKEKNQHNARREIINEVVHYVQKSCDLSKAEQDANILDSIICILAAKDFLTGKVHYPESLEVAKKEGWIWIKSQ